MNIKLTCLISVIAVCSFSCRNTKKEQPAATPPESSENDFVPYVALLNDQIRLVDSTPLAIFKYTTGSNGKTDTTIIQREEFHQLAKEFLEPDIMSAELRKDYTANSFGDKTTRLTNFTYDTKVPAHPVQRVNLRFIPGSPSKLTSLDILKRSSGVTQKLYWKSDYYFHIVTEAGDGKYTRVEVSWNAVVPEPDMP